MPAARTCSVCGLAAADDTPVPLGWSAETMRTGDVSDVRLTCPDCTRCFVRSIEAKLEQEWW